MKKTFFYILLSILSLTLELYAQEKIKNIVSDKYQRNSISIIYISRGDNYDSQLKKYVETYFMNSQNVSKYDINYIDTKELHVSASRNETIQTEAFSNNEVFQSISKQILAYWFNRKSDGTMDASLIEKRGRYNVTDQDYFNAQVAKTGIAALKDEGYDLIKNSYVLFLDYSNIKKEVNDNGTVSWSSQANIYVYQLNYTDDVYNNIMNTWIYEDDTESAKRQKIELWNNTNVGLKFIVSSHYSSTKTENNGGLEASVVESYQSAIQTIENKIETWRVASSITHVQPLRAKIGTKEGLKNTARYRAYIYTEDENGNLKSIPKGYVRATKIADNKINASGETPESEFYQISGFKLTEGAILKQRNDWGLGVGLSYKGGSFDGYYLNLSKLANIKTNGISQYALANIGLNFYSESKLKENDLYTSTASGVNFVNVSIGYGIGIRPFIRYFEFMPYILVGVDNININGEESETSEESSFGEKIAYTGSAGIKLNMNLKYPLILFGSIDYTMLLYQGELYEERNNILGNIGRNNGVGYSIGLKYIF